MTKAIYERILGDYILVVLSMLLVQTSEHSDTAWMTAIGEAMAREAGWW